MGNLFATAHIGLFVASSLPVCHKRIRAGTCGLPGEGRTEVVLSRPSDERVTHGWG